MTAIVEGAHLLNNFTKEVLRQAAKAEPSVPEHWRIKVSASSDVSIEHVGGHWAGVQLRGWGGNERWEMWRGSLAPVDTNPEYPSLEAAIAACVALESGSTGGPS